MLPTEPQLNRCLDFTFRRVVMSSKMFFQLGKQTAIRRFQLGAARSRVIRVCSCYRTGLSSIVVLLKVMLQRVMERKVSVLTVRSSAG